MILASPETIKKWTEAGAWGTDKTLVDCFKEHVRKQPDMVCLVDPMNKETLLGQKPERLTYKELDRAVDATAEAFLALGIKKDDIIMVQLPNCWELAMLYLAITRAGALISPMPMQWRKSEYEFIAGLTKAVAVITVDDFGGFKHKEMVEDVQSRQPSIKHVLTFQQIREMAQGEVTGKLDKIHINPNDIFTLCWSSGTEAQPKGCPLSHNNWLFIADLLFESAPIQPGDSFLVAGPLVNMAAIGTLFVPWLKGGGKFVLHHPFDGPMFVMQIIMEEINYTVLVPAIVNAILKHPKVDQFDFSKIRVIVIGAAPPSLWSVQELKRRWGTEFCNIWGQNEGTADIAGPWQIKDMETRVDHFPHFGKPAGTWNKGKYAFIDMKLIDALTQQKLTEEGKVGELWYRGPNVIPGYFMRPDLTEKSFDKDGYINTGDIFQVKDGDCVGYFERSKDIIIRGGFNVSAQEVENIVLSYPKVLDCAAVAMPDEIMGERTCIYVVAKPGETVTLEEIVAFMKEKGLAVYKIPERLEMIDAIPRNAVGKVTKHVLRADIIKKLKAS